MRLLVIFLIIFLLYSYRGQILRFFIKRIFRSLQNTQQTTQQTSKQSKPKPEAPKQKKIIHSNVGEYVDYEEIKD